jgi:hypothetical protein
MNTSTDTTGPARTQAIHNEPTTSLRTASTVAGIALLVLAVLAAFANFVVVEGLVTPGDADRTARDIAASEGLFRWGVASLFVVAVLDIIVAAALLQVFTPVSRSISMLAAWFRLAYAGVFLVAISQLAGVLPLTGDVSHALSQIEAFDNIWNASLILFGVHLVLLGYLAYRSGFAPKLIGILLLVAGLGYLVDSLGTVLVPDYSVGVSQFTFVGEVVLIFWLLIKGRRVVVSHRPEESIG